MRIRVIAATTALWLIVSAVLAAHHEATVVHIRNAAGAYVHGQALAGHHQGPISDIHGQRHPGADAGECALLNAFHQPASADVTAPAVVTTACAIHVRHIVPDADSAIAFAVYRLAPKTSPPAVA
jgi:hypothetical protein